MMARRLLVLAALVLMLPCCRTARVKSLPATGCAAKDTVFSLTLIGRECAFADHADYGFYIPSTAKRIRGVMVFQHGCSQEEFGLSRHCDIQYQAFARKWDLAIVETNIFGLCDVWAYPSNGSYAALLLALTKAAKLSSHPELPDAPFLLWGHSGGGFWTLSMLHEHPERIIAAVCYSAAWDPQWEYPSAAYDVPVIFRHAGPGEGADNIPATANHSFAHFRSHDAPAAIAYTRGQGHNFSYMRSMTIPFWEAALKQRLAPDGSLQPLDRGQTFLGDPETFSICREKYYDGDKSCLCLLADQECAEAWREYARDGQVTDKTPPQKPYDLKIVRDGDKQKLTWRAEADIESGINHFNIYCNGELVGRIPEEGVYQDYDRNGDQALPVNPPAMEFPIPDSTNVVYQVETVNRSGLNSEKAEVIR
ncbi:MAG: hypothetical protein IJS30_02345 [Bacteroidales bacterium]|nr:hypothetical protein [Bacteroidales bacterium]